MIAAPVHDEQGTEHRRPYERERGHAASASGVMYQVAGLVGCLAASAGFALAAALPALLLPSMGSKPLPEGADGGGD